jgi:two-component system cell cycle response regulator
MNPKGAILIADDEAVGRETLESLLIAEDYDLFFATNGPETIEKARDLIPDLILLDVMMPGMNGFDVCRHLRTDKFLAEVPIIMITALDDRDSRIEGIEAGADDFISKPFDRTELRARVKSITRLNRYRNLLNERQKFEWVINQSEDGYLIINSKDEILFANPSSRLLLNLPMEEDRPITGKFSDIVRKNYNCEPEDIWKNWPNELVKNTNQQTLRYLVRPATQIEENLWLLVETLNLPAISGHNLVVRLHDVTEKVSNQRDIWLFHSMITHKLRTPFNSILGMMNLIKDETSKLSNPKLADFSKLALEGANRYFNSLESILQYVNVSKVIQSGPGFNLSDLSSLISNLRTDLKVGSILVSVDENLKDEKLTLAGNIFEIILLKILENSKKFHPDNMPKIEIKVSAADSKNIKIQIGDNGISLSPDELSKIWTPYYQVDKYITGEIKGMGLGLSLVSSLVWQVGGTCSAFNQEKGSGIVIELILPVQNN